MTGRFRESLNLAGLSALMFLACRALDLLTVAIVAGLKGSSIWKLMTGWDSGWLLSAAVHGWPHFIPTSASGMSQQSTLPWPVLVPSIGRFFGHVGGSGWIEPSLVVSNLIGGAVAAAVLTVTLGPFLGATSSLTVSALWSALPATPVLLMGYSEGVFTALAFCCLWAATRSRFVLSGIFVVLAGLAKVSVVPFAVMLVIVVLVSVARPSPARTPRWRAAVAIGLSAIGVVIWPLAIALRVHQWNGFVVSQSAWNRASAPLVDAGRWFVSAFASPTLNTWIGLVVMTAYIAAAVIVWRDRQYPLAFRVLSLIAPFFLLAVGPQLSTARELVPDPGLSAALQRSLPGKWLLVSTFAVLVVLRGCWIYVFMAAGAGSSAP